MPYYRPYNRGALFLNTRQQFESPPPNSYRGANFGVPQRPYLHPYNRRAPMDLNTMMGHVGTITNGMNMMQQIVGMMSLFR